MNDTIGIKVPQNSSVAKCVAVLRKLTSMSIGEIKTKILEEDYLLQYDYTDEEGLQSIIKCYELLNKQGIKGQLFEHGRPCSVSFLRNLNGLYSEISDYVDRQIELESSND